MAACRLAIGELASEDLPDLATDALVRGLDSPSLRVLAGQSRDDVRDSADLFRSALDEIDVELPNPDAARWRIARSIAADIVANRKSPGLGANELWMLAEDVRDSGDLRIFIGLASQWDDHPEDVEELSLQIVREAQQLLDRAEPRIWLRLKAVLDDSPLTRSVGPDAVALDPSSLAVRSGVVTELDRWMTDYRSVLSDWPRSGGFDSVGAAESFVDRGKRLAAQLQAELGANYHVEYWPEPIRAPGVKLALQVRRRRGFWHR